MVGIIRPRVEEIVEMISQHLSINGHTSIAGYRLVLTGGASQLAGMRELATEFFHAQTRLAKPVSLEGMAESIKGPGFSCAIGLIHYVEISQPVSTLAEEGSLSPVTLIPRFLKWLQQNF